MKNNIMRQILSKIFPSYIAVLLLVVCKFSLVASHSHKIFWFTCGTSKKATFFVCSWHSANQASSGGGLYVKGQNGVETFHKFDSDIGIPWADVPWPDGPGSGESLQCANHRSRNAPSCRQVSINLETDFYYYIRPSASTAVETPACTFSSLGQIQPIRSKRMVPSAVYWLGYISEETGSNGNQCGEAYIGSGGKCTGGYCDNVSMHCSSFTGAGSVVARQNSGWFNDNDPAKYCATDYFVDGWACRYGNCQDLYLKCKKFANIIPLNSDCYWGATYSEEQWGDAARQGYAMFGINCHGRKCDNKNNYYCRVINKIPSADDSIDTDPPKISVCQPSNLSIIQQPGSCVQATAPDYRNQIVASDCSDLTFSQLPAPGSLIPRGESRITVTASDKSLNTASCITTVNFQTERTCIAPDNVLCGSHLPGKAVLYRGNKLANVVNTVAANSCSTLLPKRLPQGELCNGCHNLDYDECKTFAQTRGFGFFNGYHSWKDRPHGCGYNGQGPTIAFNNNINPNNKLTLIKMVCKSIVPPATSTPVIADGSVNVSWKKLTTQSSTRNVGGLLFDSDYAVDGRTNGDVNIDLFACTNIETNPWWKVDLEDNFIIHKVVVFNRGDDNGLAQEDLRGFEVRLLDSGNNLINSQTYGPDEAIILGGTSKSFSFNNNEARYVEIVKPGNFALAIAEVQVYAHPSAQLDDLPGFVGTDWKHASQWCRDHNSRLSTWDEVCRASSANTFPYLNPKLGGYADSEKWLPVGCAGLNEWVMIGQKDMYDQCMLHSFVYGSKPERMGDANEPSDTISTIMCTPLDDMPLPSTCDNGLVAGDIVTIAFNTDSFSVSKPVVVLMSLANITAGTTFYMTDTTIDPYGELKQVSGESWINKRNGQTSTNPTDGTMKFVAPENIAAGSKIAYSAHSTYFINGANYVNNWSPVHFKTHSPLATPEFWLYSVPPTDTVNYDLLGGDNIHLYCMSGTEKVFLHSLIFPNQTDWLPNDVSTTGSLTSNSFEPYPYSTAESVQLIGFDHPRDNHFRFRPQACGKNKTEYMKLLKDRNNWDYQMMAHQPVAITNTSNVTNPYSEFCNPKPDTREAAMSQMTQQLLIEEAVQEAEQAVEMAQMTVAVEIEAREAFHKKNNEFRDRGSLYLPDGVTIIKGNENLMTQGIDPRTPIGFGNPFLTEGTADAQQARLQVILASMATEVGTGENQQTKKIHPLGGDESSFGTW